MENVILVQVLLYFYIVCIVFVFCYDVFINNLFKIENPLEYLKTLYFLLLRMIISPIIVIYYFTIKK